MTYRLIIALRQFYKRREHVTKRMLTTQVDKQLKNPRKRNCSDKNDKL